MKRFMYIYLMLAIEELDIKYARDKIVDEEIPDKGIIRPEIGRRARILLSTDLKIWHENHEVTARAEWEETEKSFADSDSLFTTNRDTLWEVVRLDAFEQWIIHKYESVLGGDEAKADS